MVFEKRENGNKWYITRDCFADPNQRILINKDSATPRLRDLPWRMLEFLMHHPNTIVQNQTLSQYVWNDSDHTSAHIAQILHRIKHLCRNIGVSDEDLYRAFESIRGQGVRFNPPYIEAGIGNFCTSTLEDVLDMDSNVFYFTKSCYMIIDRQVLVNDDKTTARLPEFPWRLLNCFMQQPDSIVLYDDLNMAIWGNLLHSPHDVAMVLHRVKKCFSEIGVTKDELNRMFITYKGVGIRFTPIAGIG